jgi:membrane protein DedA with SNARE-associated domain
MLDSLTNAISGSLWAYPIILGIAFLDSFFPVVPSETAVITGGVLAASGDLSIVFVIVAGAVGACAGDNFTYWLGRTFGGRLSQTLFRGPRGQRTLSWAERNLDAHGTTLILVARFIPGGRTATMFMCGLTEYPWHRFFLLTLIAATGWALYAGLLGYFGGKTFENNTLAGLLLAFAIAGVVTVVIEVVRRVRARRRTS